MDKYFGVSEMVGRDEIVNVLRKKFPGRWKSFESCKNHVSGVCSRELKIIPVNDTKPPFYSRTDALRIVDWVSYHWQKRKNVEQMPNEDSVEQYENLEIDFDYPIFPEEVTQEMIADKIMEEFPGRWKHKNSAKAYVSMAMKRMKIYPIRKDLVTILPDGTPSQINIYTQADALNTYNKIVSNKYDNKSGDSNRIHIDFKKAGEFHLSNATDIGKEAIRIIDEESVRTGKKRNIIAAEMIVGYRNDHPIELTEEDKLRIEIKKLKNELKKYQKGENT